MNNYRFSGDAGSGYLFTGPWAWVSNGEVQARVSEDWKLLSFDAAKVIAHEKARTDRDPHNTMYMHEVILAGAIELAAQQVDHILKDGGGTYGDAIRCMRLDYTPPKRNPYDIGNLNYRIPVKP